MDLVLDHERERIEQGRLGRNRHQREVGQITHRQ
jgi:hypothetical protein